MTTLVAFIIAILITALLWKPVTNYFTKDLPNSTGSIGEAMFYTMAVPAGTFIISFWVIQILLWVIF